MQTAALIDAEAAEQLAQAEHTADLRRATIRDNQRHRTRQAEWDGIRQWATANGFTVHKHYDLIDPHGLVIETAYVGGGEAECRLYTTWPHGRNQQRTALYRFNGRNTEPVLPHLQAEIRRQRARIARRTNRESSGK